MSARARLNSRTLSLAAAATGVASGIALQRRHLRRLEHDSDLARLSGAAGGRPLGQIVSADGTRLHAEAFGPDDGHTFVLVHGWTEQLSFWGPVTELLTAQGFRVVAYDLRGHGRSDVAADGDYALERFGDDVEAVLAAAISGAGERGKATVVGHSLGAMSIAAWAGRHDVTARAAAAALVNTGLGDLLAGHLLFGEAARWLNHPWASRLVLGSRAPVLPFSTPISHALVRYVAFGPSATNGDVAFYERMLITCPADVRAACGVVLSDMDLWEAVTGLTVPTLVVAGERDRLTPPAHARMIIERIPSPTRLIELPETGHMSPLERPRELADALAELAGSVAATERVPATSG